MHDDEVGIDERLVRRLIGAQHAQWAELSLERVESTGTVHVLFRLGDQLAVRLPRTPRWHDLDQELCWLGWLAPRLPIAVPRVVATGSPAEGYPWPWAVFEWIEGRTWALEEVADPCAAALELADVLQAVHRIDPADAPCGPPGATGPLAAHDTSVREAIDAARGMLDTDAVLDAWRTALDVAAWDGPPLLVHGDVLAGNVLVRDGRLCAVIDWGGLQVGDPARDLTAAWTMFSGASRQRFRAAMAFDDAMWRRARGWALTRITNVAYYAVTNPNFSRDACTTIEAVLDDPA